MSTAGGSGPPRGARRADAALALALLFVTGRELVACRGYVHGALHNVGDKAGDGAGQRVVLFWDDTASEASESAIVLSQRTTGSCALCSVFTM